MAERLLISVRFHVLKDVRGSVCWDDCAYLLLSAFISCLIPVLRI